MFELSYKSPALILTGYGSILSRASAEIRGYLICAGIMHLYRKLVNPFLGNAYYICDDDKSKQVRIVPTDEPSIETSMALIRQDQGYMRSDLRDIKSQLSSLYVTKEEFLSYKQKVDAIWRALVWVVGVLILGIAGLFFNLLGHK